MYSFLQHRKKPVAFILCSGLGKITRGYESFTRECYDALKITPELELFLFKGGGPASNHEKALWNLSRQSKLSQWSGRITGRGAYFIEQLTFFLSLIPHLFFKRPDVVYFSDGNLGNLLWHWRRFTGQKYRLLFSNGGPLSPPFPRWDGVQQVAPTHYQQALTEGEPEAKQFLVPYGFMVPFAPFRISDPQRRALRQKLSLPLETPVLISVGALNCSHKRMDYVIREVASLPQPQPYLVLLGQPDEETPAILQLAEKLLSPGAWQAKSVDTLIVGEYLHAADVFILASLGEGFGRATIEAALHGLPCLLHDYELAHYLLQEDGFYGDFTQPGALATQITKALAASDQRLTRHTNAARRFGWDHLKSEYVQMLLRCASSHD